MMMMCTNSSGKRNFSTRDRVFRVGQCQEKMARIERKTIFSSSQGQLRVKDSPKCAHDDDVGRILRWGKFIDATMMM